jgi:hypothetical protein
MSQFSLKIGLKEYIPKPIYISFYCPASIYSSLSLCFKKIKNWFFGYRSVFFSILYKNESPFVSFAKTQKRLDRFEYLFFLLFALIQGWFKKKKNWKSCPENWKIREKLKVLFSMGTAGTISDFF